MNKLDDREDRGMKIGGLTGGDTYFEEARTDVRAARERKEQERRIHRIYQKQHRKQKRGEA